MSKPSLPLSSVTAATGRFLTEAINGGPWRVVARVSSAEGMPLLCAVEAALEQARPRPSAQELIWLSRAPEGGAHRLQLQAFGPGGALLGEAVHEFAG